MGARWAVGRGRAVAVILVVLLVAVPAAALAADDPYRPQQWHLDRIGAPAVWNVVQGAGHIVAVVDSGIDLEHPDLVDQLARRADGGVLGRDFVDGDRRPDDEHGHGTMVAGVVAASLANGVGGVGVAPRTRLMPVRVLDEDGQGTQSDVEAGIRWAVDNGATVVNLSLESAVDAAGALPLGLTAPVDAVRYAWDRGVPVVAAAGNSGSPFTDYPRSSPVLLVGATDQQDRSADFSDSGRDDIIMAPGVGIVSTWCRETGDDQCTDGTHTYGKADGTSFAAPQVAAGLALLRETGLGPDAAVQRVRDTARDLGRPGPDRDTGVGLLDLRAAIGPARTAGGSPPSQPEPTPTPTPSTRAPNPDPTTPPGAPTPDPVESSPAPQPTSPSPVATDQPTPGADEPTGTEQASDGTSDDVSLVTIEPANPASATDPPPSPARTAWAMVALALVAGTVALVARALVDQP